MDEIEQLLAKPDPIPMEDVPYGLLNRVRDLLEIKDAEIKRLRTIMDQISSMEGREGINDHIFAKEVLALTNDALGPPKDTGEHQ